MPARLITPTEPIEVKQLCCLIYGQGGSRKTSLCQTANRPITLAFDQKGLHRAYGRKDAVLFDTWSEVVEFDLSPYATIVVDTIGMALDKLSAAIIADNPKHGNRMGGLSLQGYGALKNQFAQWVASINDRGQDLIFTAHEKTEKVGDELYECPDIVGGSYNTLMNHCDVVAYCHFANGKRVLDFAPSDRWMAKTPPCGWGTIAIPDFAKEPHFLADLLSKAKESMGQVSADSAAVATLVEQWTKFIATLADAAAFNAALAEMPKEVKNAGALAVLKKTLWTAAQGKGLDFNKQTKQFFAPVPEEEQFSDEVEQQDEGAAA